MLTVLSAQAATELARKGTFYPRHAACWPHLISHHLALKNVDVDCKYKINLYFYIGSQNPGNKVYVGEDDADWLAFVENIGSLPNIVIYMEPKRKPYTGSWWAPKRWFVWVGFGVEKEFELLPVKKEPTSQSVNGKIYNWCN